MNEEIDVYLDSSGGYYLESLIKSRKILLSDPTYIKDTLIFKIEEVISLELDLAILGSEKAKREVLKNTKLSEAKDNLRPIK